MRIPRLGDKGSKIGPEDVSALGGVLMPGAPWTNGESEGVREIRHFGVSPKGEKKERDVLAGGLLAVAGLIIAVSLAGAGYIAYEAQRLFTLEHNGGDQVRAAIEAGLADAGWAAMAIVALVAALKGRSSLRARAGVVLFFGLSLGAQVMYAEPTMEGYLVAVIPPIVLAWMLESFVVEVRRWAISKRGLDLDESPILGSVFGWLLRTPQRVARFVLWLLRLAIDPKGTAGGARTWVLETAPIAPGRTLMTQRAAAALEQAGTAEQQAAAAREAAQVEIERVRSEADQRVAELHAATAEEKNALVQAAEQRLAEERAQTANLRAAVERLERESEALFASATAKSRLITLYERLGQQGDRRYGDRSAVGEVARELAGQAGFASEGTARANLTEYLDSTVARPEAGVMS